MRSAVPLALAAVAALAATSAEAGRPPAWRATSAPNGHCTVEVRGKVVVKRGRGEMTCTRRRGELACLWTHTNGFYQEAWLIDLRRRRVRDIAMPAWGSGEVVRLIKWHRGQLEIWIEQVARPARVKPSKLSGTSPSSSS